MYLSKSKGPRLPWLKNKNKYKKDDIWQQPNDNWHQYYFLYIMKTLTVFTSWLTENIVNSYSILFFSLEVNKKQIIDQAKLCVIKCLAVIVWQ